MNPLKKGPQIKRPEKMPELKVPAFLSDLYRDLRDRHLLPLVALLVIAIVAAPIALGESGGPEESTAPASLPTVGSPSSAGSPARKVVVARSTPGLRSYHRRLRHLTAADPFKQQYTSQPASEENTAGETSSGGSSSSESEATVTHEEGETVTQTHEFKYFTYTIDVRIVPVSSKGVPSTAKPSVRHNLPELTQLPSRQIPALVFMEPTADAKKAVMLVSSNVRALFGEGVCIVGGETCQLLALKPNLPETVVYGGSERTFRIELLKVELTPTEKLTKAPLGKNKSKSSNRPGVSPQAELEVQPR